MIYENTDQSRRLNTVAGSAVFFLIVAGGTYLFQSTLVLVKLVNPYFHWAVLLMALPALAGLSQRYMKIVYPMSTVTFGTLASVVMLYPQYSQQFWAVPPTVLNVIVYLIIVVGIGFVATQSIATVYEKAFHLGRFKRTKSRSSKKVKKKVARRGSNALARRLGFDNRGDMIAMMELMIGVISLVLSLFSIFFLGQA
jgi:hypothetical protein